MRDEDKLAESSLPSSPHIEVAVLGAMILDGKAILEATSSLAAEDFHLDSHQRIYRCILGLMNRPGEIDMLMVQEDLSRRRELNSIGGAAYLAFLTEGIPRNFNIEAYVRVIKEKKLARSAMALAHDLHLEAGDGQEDAQHLVERAATAFQELAMASTDGALQSAAEHLADQGPPEQMFERMADTNGIRVGFNRFDQATNGLKRKTLTVVGARPGMGKTSFAIKIAYNVAVTSGLVVAFFTLEQDVPTMIRRMLASAALVDYRNIQKNRLTPHEKVLLREKREMLEAAPLYMDDTAGMTCTRIRSKCQRLKAKLGQLDLVIIDQISHMPWTDVYEKGMTPAMLIGKQSKFLKRMGKELDVPVVAFNQLKRADSKDVRPKLTDLKESGSLEEDADLVVFLHRPEYYNRSDESLKGKAEIILAKNREGQVADIDCEYDGSVMNWKDEVATQEGFDSYASNW